MIITNLDIKTRLPISGCGGNNYVINHRTLCLQKSLFWSLEMVVYKDVNAKLDDVKWLMLLVLIQNIAMSNDKELIWN